MGDWFEKESSESEPEYTDLRDWLKGRDVRRPQPSSEEIKMTILTDEARERLAKLMLNNTYVRYFLGLE